MAAVARLDSLTKEERSRRMALVKSRDTAPELSVRRAVWKLGFRYRLHRAGIPGCPDIVLGRHRKVIFVHGCFWHRHPNCSRTRVPRTRVAFWRRKFRENVARDRHARATLSGMGWRSLVVWECVSEKPLVLERQLARFLGGVS